MLLFAVRRLSGLPLFVQSKAVGFGFLSALFASLGCASAGLALPLYPPTFPTLDVSDPLTYRSFDGGSNNLANPSWGRAGTQLRRLLEPDYAGGATPAGGDRPSPRVISNALGPQTGPMPSSKNVTAAFWAFGQLLAHDIDLTGSAQPKESFNIAVPPGDFGGAISELPFARSVYDPATGSGPANPRQQLNEITAYIDASFVYGSDPMTAASLRRMDGSGKLWTGPEGLLPTNGQLMIDADPSNDYQFVAGDVRANEQLALMSMQTLFLREHNRLATSIAQSDPGLSGDEIFQIARSVVGAEMQAITANEFLPILLGEQHGLGAYAGYDPTVNPGIANAFSTAAFRLGHTMIQDEFLIVSKMGATETVPVTACFFTPSCLQEKGVASVLRGLAKQDAQEVDTRFIDAIRNQLITDFGITLGVDLAALNIQRGRDHGLPSYQDAWYQLLAMGLVSGSDGLPQGVLDTYEGASVDLFIGGLSVEPYLDSLIGELFHAILSDQFSRLRAGDRFWFENLAFHDPGLVGWLNDLRLSDLFAWNTDIGYIQSNVFVSSIRQYVPEPGVAWMIVTGLALMWWMRRRDKRAPLAT